MLRNENSPIEVTLTNDSICMFKFLKKEIKQNTTLSTSMQKILKIIENTEAVIKKDPNRMELLCNDALYEINQTVLSPALANSQTTWYRMWHKQNNEKFYAKWERALRDIRPTILLTFTDDPSFISSSNYVARMKPAFEVNKNQPILTIEQLILYIHQLSYEQIAGFIFVADKETGKVRFSPGTVTAYHINVFQSSPASGAGEVYFKKSLYGIELIKLNNRSGLYLPDNTFMKDLKEWFSNCGILTNRTSIEDEKAKQIEDMVGMRWLGR